MWFERLLSGPFFNWLRDCLKGYQTYQEKNPTYVKKNEVGEVGEVGEVVDKSKSKRY